MAHAHGFVIIDVITKVYPSEILKMFKLPHARRRPCIKVLSQGNVCKENKQGHKKSQVDLVVVPKATARASLFSIRLVTGDLLPARGGVAFDAIKTMSASVVRSQGRGREEAQTGAVQMEEQCSKQSMLQALRSPRVVGYFGVKWSLPAKM